MSEKSFEEKIIEDINKTGFPLEANIAAKLKKLDWKLTYSSYYIDKDEKKGREIDLIASNHFNSNMDNDGYIEYNMNILIEIKKAIKYPWIFFTSENGIQYPYNIAVNTGINNKKFTVESVMNKNKKEFYKEVIGRSFYEGFTSNGGRDDIYKALTGLTKALYHFKELDFVQSDESTDYLISFYDLVLVVEGSTFEAEITTEGSINLTETDYVQVAFNYLSPEYNTKSTLNHSNEIRIHVVNSRFLEEFITALKLKHRKLFDDIKDKLNQRN